jgi:glutathione synthase/RimK-type ligase-like ATP-grasp enzyme
MLFILTNSQDETASFLISVLEKSGIPFLRLDTDCLIPRIALSYRPGKPAIKIDNRWYGADEVSHIWYRRPEQLKDTRFDSSPESKYTRSEWTEFVECFFAHVPEERWINHPARNAAASRKLEQLTTASKLGLKVPDTLVTQDPHELRAFYQKHEGRVIVKPLSTGYIERTGEEEDTLIYTSQVLEKHLEDLEDMAVCPTLFQQFIQKRNDVRITVVDSDVHAVELLAGDRPGEQRCDIRRNNMSDVVYRPITLPEDVKVALQKLMEHYRLRFGAIDMAVADTGGWYFLEINPNGQWAWLDMTAGTKIASSFVKILSGGICGELCAIPYLP